MQILDDDLKELEFPQLLEQIAPLAYCPLVSEKILALFPLPFEKAKTALEKTSEYLRSFESGNLIPFGEYGDILQELRVIEIENYRLDAPSFIKIKTIAEQVLRIQKYLLTFKETFPILSSEIEKIPYEKEIVLKIDRVFNRFGEIKNEASALLKELRGEIQNAEKAISQNFNRALSQYSSQDLLDDIRESIVDDQRVLAVKSGFKKRVAGRVLGVSKTGSITFVQPESVLKHYFRKREAQEEEKKETDRILRTLTSEIALFASLLAEYQDYLFDLDLTQSKARMAEKMNGVLPKLNLHSTLRLKDAYHPLLYLKNKENNKEIFPQTLTLTEHNRILCISGPNAGGKSITLKTVGLLQLMIQSGLLVPVHPKSEMFFFDRISTDIGDGQSIENHLSTYSSRLKKMASIIEVADEKSLLLIDEFGTGSDPELGGALAESFLEFFYKKRSFAIITTHYTNIKLLVESLPNAQNAAMLFDEKTLTPLYKLEVGQAGSSFTFEVAEKNRIPRGIIASARKKVEKDVVNLDKTIVRLQQEKFEVEKLRSGLKETKESAEAKKENLEKLNEQLELRLFNFQKLYENEHRKLSFGNKIEEFIRSYSRGKSRKEVVRDFVKLLEQEKFKHLETHKDDQKQLQIVKRKVTQSLKKKDLQEKIIKTNELKEKRVEEERKLWLVPGQRVRIVGSSSVGTIEKVQKNKVTVNFGHIKTTTDSSQLERI